MAPKTAFLLIIVTIIFSSCSFEYYNNLFYDQELHGIQIAGQVTEIEIIDKRLPNTISELKIPSFQLFNYHTTAHPALTDKNKEELERKVRSFFSRTGRNLKVKCYIANTVKKIEKGCFHFREFALVEMSIAIYTENDKLLDFSSGTAYFEHKPSTNVKYEINLVFEKVLREAIYRCFDDFKSIKKTVTVGQTFRYSVIKKED